ncbi:MAG TPA: FAD-dependent oxidoreductase [Thermoanaerobaculia bacterium]|nr:FAD-dependent oxidoreductase [Thermoanaerobaculia bacterium]
MEIVYRLDPRFNKAREISNARFNYNPAVIYFCESVADVQKAISDAKAQGLYVRVRSGGHQHEGMCSGPNVLIIDVSRIAVIKVEGDQVRLGPGAKLGKVYSTLWDAGMLFPGGGCKDVCVGGLVQGAGWGPYGRSLGFTCDSLTWFRMVKADGSCVEVTNSPTDKNADLFWAVCGGGGGNFGVITEFLFRPGRLTTPIWSFTAKWADASLVKKVIIDWRDNFPDKADRRLTSFARLSAVKGNSPDPAAIVAGFFIGKQEDLQPMVQRLLPNTWASAKICYDPVYEKKEGGARAFQHPEYQPGPPSDAVRALAAFGDAPPGDLSDTCAGVPFPHKIRPAFPRRDSEMRRWRPSPATSPIPRPRPPTAVT